MYTAQVKFGALPASSNGTGRIIVKMTMTEAQADDELKAVGVGEVEGVYVAEASGEPMKELAKADVIAHRGIRGDRYMMRQGTYSVFRTSTKEPGRREPGRQLTLVSAEGVEQSFIMNGIEALKSLGNLRRNVVVRGIPAAVLQAAVGHEIALGDEVVIFAHRACVPCMYNERKNGRKGLMEATWDVGGLNCEVLKGGTLKPGDQVRISPEEFPKRIDGGQQAPGFFTRPSKRTRQEVVLAQQMQAAALPKLLEVDPAGVARALESYHSVGLQLFKRPKRFRRADALQERFCTMVGIFIVLIMVLWTAQHGERMYNESSLPARWARFAAMVGLK